jgi:hypothetical protein
VLRLPRPACRSPAAPISQIACAPPHRLSCEICDIDVCSRCFNDLDSATKEVYLEAMNLNHENIPLQTTERRCC